MDEQLEKQEQESLAAEAKGNFPVNDLLDRYDIKKAAMYNRLNFLKITPVKEKGKSFLLPEQLHHMDELDKHIKTHNTMEGYPVPEWNLEQHTGEEEEVTGELAIAPDTSITAPETPVTVTQQIELATPPSPEIDTNRIAQNALTIAKEIIISKRLGQNLAENPDLLPDEDKQEIEAITQQFAAHFPKAQRKRPEELAKAMLVKFSQPQPPAVVV